MKKITLLLALSLLTLTSVVAQTIDRVEPLFWWTGMKNPELQIMVYGEDIGAQLSDDAEEIIQRAGFIRNKSGYLHRSALHQGLHQATRSHRQRQDR